MEKPIIVTNIDGLLLEHETFIEPHKAWFDRAIEKTGDNSLEEWKGHKEYFKGVNKAMEKIMPDAPLEKRTAQARKWYSKPTKFFGYFVSFLSPKPTKRNLRIKLVCYIRKMLLNI